jgi:nicotinamide-nucleotide amidase
MPSVHLRVAGATVASAGTSHAYIGSARFGADVGVGVTGIAGPGGATPDKPVGTVHLAAVGPEGAVTRSLTLSGSRDTVRQRSVVLALHLLRQLLLGGPTV